MQQIPDDHLSRDKLLSSYGYDKIPKPPQDQEALSRSTSERLNKIKEAVLEVQKLMGSESESFNQYLKENSLLERCELTEQFSKVFEDPQLFANVHLGSSSIGTGYEGLSPDATKAYIKNLLRELYNNRDLGVSIPAEAVLALWTLVEGRYKLESQQLQTSMGIGANNPIEALEKTDELIKQSQSSKLLEKLESGNRPIIAQEIAKRVAYLGIGKSYLMYGGYRSIPSGHAVYYQFKRVSETAYDVYVYNAQQGVMESQGGIITAEKTRGVRCKYFREVPQKVFLFSDNPKEVKGGFFKPLLDILDKTQNSKTAQTCLRTVFESLAPFQDSPTHLEDLFGTLQRAGNCTIHSFNALLFGLYVQESENPKVGVEQYKVTILQARLLSLIAFYRNKEKEIQEDTQDAAQIRFMIKEAAQGLCQRYSKSVNNEKMTDKLLKGSLYTAKDILLRLETIEKNLDKDRVEKDTIPATTVNRKEQAERLESLSDTLVSKGSPLEEATVQVDLSEKIVPLISSSNNPIQLLEQLDKQLSEIAFCGDQWVPLTYIENMVSLLPLSAEGSVWSGLSVEDASISLEKIDRIFSLYTSYIEDLKEIDHLKSQNTLFQLIGIADQLCRVIDQKKQLNFMQGFGLDMLPLEESFLNPNLFFGSEQEINKRNKIQSYFKNQSQEKGTLFAFEKQHVRKSDDPKKRASILPQFNSTISRD